MPPKHGTADGHHPPIGFIFSNPEGPHRKHHLPPTIQTTYAKNGFVFANTKISPHTPYPSALQFAIIVNYPDSDILKGI